MTPFIAKDDLPDHGLTVGLIKLPGVGYRVATQDAGGEQRHMSAAAARRLARELEQTEEAVALAPVTVALNKAASALETALSVPLGNA